ncbi:MAG: tRNA pseudouridine synthase A [Myxococcota bacterium]
MPSRVVALWCWYHGGAFRGYQSQPDGPTVQDTLLTALRRAGFERNPVPSGRTDAGVHARMQVLSMRLVEEGVSHAEVAARINAELPATVGIACVRPAHAKFHAHWKSSGKEYRYRLGRRDDPWTWKVAADAERVGALLSLAVGTRDFAAFHDASSPVKARTIDAVDVVREGDRVEVRMRGAGFGRYMVRLLVGAAVAVARGEASEADYRAALERAAPFPRFRAPANGLILWEVFYPPADDPFSADDRRLAPGVPGEPPFA